MPFREHGQQRHFLCVKMQIAFLSPALWTERARGFQSDLLFALKGHTLLPRWPGQDNIIWSNRAKLGEKHKKNPKQNSTPQKQLYIHIHISIFKSLNQNSYILVFKKYLRHLCNFFYRCLCMCRCIYITSVTSLLVHRLNLVVYRKIPQENVFWGQRTQQTRTEKWWSIRTAGLG